MTEYYGRQIAKLYDRLEHNPSDALVASAYRQFKAEIMEQYELLRYCGITVVMASENPYPTSLHMFNDIRIGYLVVYTGGTLPGDHPLAEPMIVGKLFTMSYNVAFRAIHDYFGHYVGQNGFGPIGENGAFIEHRQMFSELAVRALTTETRGQNSWFNFGPHSDKPVDVRPFAEQKAGLLPVWVSRV